MLCQHCRSMVDGMPHKSKPEPLPQGLTIGRPLHCPLHYLLLRQATSRDKRSALLVKRSHARFQSSNKEALL